MVRPLLLALVLSIPCFAQTPEELAKARAKVRALELDMQALIDKVSPSVGAVTNYAARFDPKTGRMSMQRRGMGSGLLVDPRGFFLTNVHVIDGAGYITVALNDGKRYPAILYADTSEGQVKGDIALLKLRGKRRFPFVSWTNGDATKLQPGAFVFAMGNPRGFALDGTPVITLGIISGKGRAAAEAGYLYVDSIQTDAEINPGNSGGPLFDARGRFVGINGLMNSRQGRSNSGVGFAIPVNQVRLFMRKLLKEEGGGVGYGFHGLQVQSAPGGGAVVMRVMPRSPASEEGLRRGDVIVKTNGKRVTNRTEFVNLVGKLPEGKLVRILFKRDGKQKSARFKLINYQAFVEEHGGRGAPRKLPLHERGFLGVEWKGGGAGGLEVTRVRAGTGAEKAGVKIGDRIVALLDRPAQTPEQIVEILSYREPDESVPLKVKRGRRDRTFRVKLCDAATQAGLGE